MIPGRRDSTAARVASTAAGAGLLAAGLRRRDWLGYFAAGAGGVLLARGLSGRAFSQMLGLATRKARDQKGGVRVSESIRVERPAESLYALWRDFASLPRFISHLSRVEVLDDKRSRWTVAGPAGVSLAWDAEIVRDLPGELISWESLDGSPVVHAGSVSFRRIPDRFETEIKVVMRYDPPAGVVGDAFASIFNEAFSARLRDDLLQFKAAAETGGSLAPDRAASSPV